MDLLLYLFREISLYRWIDRSLDLSLGLPSFVANDIPHRIRVKPILAIQTAQLWFAARGDRLAISCKYVCHWRSQNHGRSLEPFHEIHATDLDSYSLKDEVDSRGYLLVRNLLPADDLKALLSEIGHGRASRMSSCKRKADENQTFGETLRQVILLHSSTAQQHVAYPLRQGQPGALRPRLQHAQLRLRHLRAHGLGSLAACASSRTATVVL
jgi:hypothetical protein